MSPTRGAVFWLLALAVLVALLILLRDILLPFVAGMALAYFLDPIADRIEARGLSRTAATWAVVLSFFVAFVALLVFLLPLLEDQLAGLAGQLPDVFRAISTRATALVELITEKLDPARVEEANAAFADLQKEALGWTMDAIRGLWRSGVALLNLLGLLIVTPVVAWYLLRDWDRMVAQIDSWLPRDQAEVIRGQIRRIDETLAGFVRGQALVCLILGGGYAVALQLAGLKYGLLVGLIAGLISFIPYIGSMVGLVLSLGLGYFQFGFSIELMIVAAIFIAGQLVEGNFLTPKLVGERVGLHAVWILFALLTGGSLFGFVGMLLAVPVAAVIGVLARFGLERYLASSLYSGQDGGDAPS
ncbi:MAG: AI-2E family transporter [Alphaproteobacteria bacterium]